MRIEMCFALEEQENEKFPVIKLGNPRWGGWAVYRSWQEVHEILGDLLEEIWDEETHYPRHPGLELQDTYEVQMDYMSEAEIAALMPLLY